MWNLRYLPEGIREEVARLALDKAPQEAAPVLMENLQYLPEGIRGKIARLALKKAPQEAAPVLMGNLECLPKGIREGIKDEVMQMLQVEKKHLKEAEDRNPVLYGETESSEGSFLRKEFEKDGTRTVLLGGSLKNKAILRIIPNHAFVAWLKAYSAVEDWGNAGFDYVPIEPILKASSCKDDKNARVYAGVLGVSVARYLTIYSNKEHHEDVKRQVEVIKKTLKKMGITYASINPNHEHDNNFCILHNRTPKGEIDWDTPPRVYCIDFDQATSS